MFDLDIPGFGPIQLKYLVSDFTGTLSVDGRLIDGVKERLNKIGDFLEIHVITADTFGKAREELKGIKGGLLHILSGENHDLQKEDYVNKIGPEKTIALGNGNNDRRMLKAARIGIAVSEGEGCSVDAIMAADIHVRSILEGLDLLLNPKRCKATLRF
jgi:soluble P-type ATPase